MVIKVIGNPDYTDIKVKHKEYITNGHFAVGKVAGVFPKYVETADFR
jgi:hypothetical protein